MEERDIDVFVQPGLCQYPRSTRMIGIVPVDWGNAGAIRKLWIDILKADLKARA